MSLEIDASRSAVLSMDMQTGIISVLLKDNLDMVPRAASLLKSARNAGLTIIHVRVGFRPKLPEISPRNKIFESLKNSPQHQQLFEGASGEIHPQVAPQGDDIVVTKHRVNAFAGTDLQMILRAKEIDTLVLFGIATSGVVLSTLLDACDADYRLIVIRDCCADPDQELHAALLERFFSRRAEIISAAEFEAALRRG
jgi:nicotinamidase-related amidase